MITTYCRSGSVGYPESPDIKNLFSVALSFELGIMGRKNYSNCILFSVYINCPEVFLSSCQTLKQMAVWDKCNVPLHQPLPS